MTELDQVLTAILQLGDAGKEAFIWWLVIDKLVATLMTGGCVIGCLLLIKWVVRRAYAESEYEAGMKRLRKHILPAESGPVTHSEIERMIDRVTEWKSIVEASKVNK